MYVIDHATFMYTDTYPNERSEAIWKELRRQVERGMYGRVIDCLRELPVSLIIETGMFGMGVSIKRSGEYNSPLRKKSVGEFLIQHENRSGSWYIDGGWGGPPGPIRVDWDDVNKKWINRGFPPH